jgi:hypothetical protein
MRSKESNIYVVEMIELLNLLFQPACIGFFFFVVYFMTLSVSDYTTSSGRMVGE